MTAKTGEKQTAKVDPQVHWDESDIQYAINVRAWANRLREMLTGWRQDAKALLDAVALGKHGTKEQKAEYAAARKFMGTLRIKSEDKTKNATDGRRDFDTMLTLIEQTLEDLGGPIEESGP